LSQDHPALRQRGVALEPSADALRAWLDRAARFVVDGIESLSDMPANGIAGAAALEVAEACSQPISEQGIEGGFEASLEVLAKAIPASFQTAGPGYLAYIPGGGIPTAALADLLADTANRFTGITAAAAALVRLEGDVLRWLCKQFGYGPRAYGLLTPGGSSANFSAFVAARVDRLSDDGDYRKAIAYTSSQAHHSVHKSLHLTGIPRANVRAVPIDERYRMRADALAEMIATDKAAGLSPYLVCGAAGTTNTGAIDPLGQIAEVCEREGLWFHVDGAYGGAFVLCEEGQRRLAGIERAHSITFDPHKGMFLPYGTGCLLVRDLQTLRAAHPSEGDYLQDFEAFERRGEVPAPADIGPELSRDYRGLRLWLPLMVHGAAAFREALNEKLELAARVDAGLEALITEGLAIEQVDRAQLSLSTFRLSRRAGEPVTQWNSRNAAWMNAINERQRAYLSSTALPHEGEDEGVFTLRTCVLSFRTHELHIDHFLEDLAATARELTS
jgi:aromatic-L-amino-acid decarboxylase